MRGTGREGTPVLSVVNDDDTTADSSSLTPKAVKKITDDRKRAA
ncbi:hypothetical protein [Streptomyces sp. enrichment culture]